VDSLALVHNDEMELWAIAIVRVGSRLCRINYLTASRFFSRERISWQ
jgi:hypothetical protein